MVRQGSVQAPHPIVLSPVLSVLLQPAMCASLPSARTCARQSMQCVGILTSWKGPCLPSFHPSTWRLGSPSQTHGSAPTRLMEKRSKWVNAAASYMCLTGSVWGGEWVGYRLWAPSPGVLQVGGESALLWHCEGDLPLQQRQPAA